MSCSLLTHGPQYWVTYAFLTVVESAINAVYWFPFYYVFKFVLVLWMALPQTG
jgi:receptor expression-enhancing protein 5/6